MPFILPEDLHCNEHGIYIRIHLYIMNIVQDIVLTVEDYLKNNIWHITSYYSFIFGKIKNAWNLPVQIFTISDVAKSLILLAF